MKTRLFFLLLFAALLATHLCHSGILWEPETFPMAAAKQMLAGKVLYRDIWYDKPPLVPIFYLLLGVRDGWVLRAAGALYSLLACFIAYLFARDLYGKREGFWAAGLLAFFLTLDLPVSVIPIGPDLLMLVPHLLAIYLAWRGKPFYSGLAAGVAFLCNAKAVFVLAACTAFCFPALFALGTGFAIPLLVAALALGTQGAWSGYLHQTWIWGAIYAGNTFIAHPVQNALQRTINWLGFHAALTVGAFHRWPWRFILWVMLSFVAVAMGWRFFPRYYLQLLPPVVILASFGFARHRSIRYAALALLFIPAIRFGPRYISLAAHGSAAWSDTEMDRDSREASAIVNHLSKPGDTLFVWGYRPEDWVYTNLKAANRFMDCQALTGVPADRHLTEPQPVSTTGTADARSEVARSNPEFIMDGLTRFNPRLSMERYPELNPWLAKYHLTGQTRFTLIYRRNAP